MRHKVLISAPYAMPVIERYRRELAAAGCEIVVADVRERLDEEQLLKVVGDIDGIICGDDRISARVLDAAPRLKVISKWGTGIDSIDSSAARARGVAVMNTPNAFSEPLADTVLGYLLIAARRLPAMDADIRAGRWVKPQLVSLREKVLGIIGLGNCGKAVARRASAFGMEIIACDVVPVSEDFLARQNVRMVPLDRLLAESDFVTLHVDLNPGTRHLINSRTLQIMKPSAFLVNTSRGPVIDEKALIEVLRARKIAGAAMDVFEEEPLPANSPLRELDNCWLAPHNANSSPQAAERVHRNTIEQLVRVLKAGEEKGGA